MIAAFEQAADDIEFHQGKKALKIITTIPEAVYELALYYYSSKPLKGKQKARDKWYYLTRYVLHHIEMQSVYCLYNHSRDAIPRSHSKDPTFKKGLHQLELYRVAYRSLAQPTIVSVDKKKVLTNLDVLSTPYQPIKQPKRQSEPTPLFN